MTDSPKKVLVAGVGGQGVVYLTNLLVEAATVAGISVAASEIHGLTQRGGTVVSGLTFGTPAFGFIERAGADFLLALEPMEAQRCLGLLHPGSRVVIDGNPVPPHSVSTSEVSYPDPKRLVNFLDRHISEVVYLAENRVRPSVFRNLAVLGRALQMDGFPLSIQAVTTALEDNASGDMAQPALNALRAHQNPNDKRGYTQPNLESPASANSEWRTSNGEL